MNTVVTVGLSGGTGAGKTSVCHLLARTLDNVCILDLDSYYLDRAGLSPEARERLNFDEPSAFDLPLLLRHLRQLRDGRSIEKPRYSFEHHTRIGSERVAPGPIVLVEGLFALWWAELRVLLNLKVFVEAPESIRLARRLQRDVATRGRTADSVRRQLDASVRPMHRRYIEPARMVADLVVVNDRDISTCAAEVRAALEAVDATLRAGSSPHASDG